MKKLFLLVFIFTTVLYAEVAIVPIDKAKGIADRNAATLWGNVNPGEPIIYYSVDDNIVAYRFNYAINTQFLDKQTLINECNQGKLENNREAQWGNGNYGNILMSARKDMPVNLEYGLGISSEYAYGAYIQEQAETHLGSNYSLKKIYYVNGVNVWYNYTNGTKDIYIKPHSPAKVGDEQEFRSAADEFEFFCETGNFEDQWDDYIFRNRIISRTVSEIPYHDECCPFYDWSYGCSPTAAAMLMAYWDHRSMYSTSNYSKFVDYHFERYDPVQGDTDSHCPNVMPQLATAMNTDLATGGTYRVDIAPGYNTVATNNGYSFSCSYNSGQTTTWYFNKVVSEINADRPLHISISGHSVTGVGYNDVDETVSTHYTHQPWLINITKSQLQATYPIIPGGAFGLGIEIEKPDGDQNYYGTGLGETLYAGDVYEITWDYDSSTGSYVKLYYNTNHGTGSWTTITSNTPNDGVYDWVIPSGINSSACRIMIYVYSSGSVFWGADGSYGDFQIYSGGSLQTLYSDSKVNTTTDPDYYQFNNPYATWCAVGVRNNTAAENWSMRMYSDNTFSTVLVSSSYIYPVDFVVLDRHHYSGINRGIKAYRFSGSNNASVEFEGDQETLIVGTNNTYVWTAGDVVEMFDVYLTPGIYSFDLDITSGSADLDFGLFGSTDAIYYKNRGAYLAQSINAGGAVDEFFTFTVTTTDYYGLCLWGNDANTSNYYVTIEKAGTWKGDVNHSWNNAGNWSASTIPDATVDVTIPAGTPNDCWVASTDQECNNITIESGASLRIYDEILTVSGNMTIYGHLQMEEYIDNGELHIAGDIIWESGSTAQILSNSLNMFITGDWNFESGANVQLTQGYVTFEGTANSWIRNYDPDCYFNHIRNLKTGTYGLAVSELSDQDLYINGNLYNNYGNLIRFRSDHSVILNGFLNNASGHFEGQFGTLVFDGWPGSTELAPNTGDYLNNVTFSTSSLLPLNNSYSNLLTINGNVLIESGGIEANNFTIEVGGNWTNSVGSAGFTEGTGRVIFNGGNYHQYCSNETFNELEVNKTAGGAFRVNGTNVVCAAYDWTAGAVDVLSGSFTANDLLDNAIQGGFYLNTGGTIDLTNSGTGLYVDLKGDLHIFGGTMTVSGSISYWPYGGDASIEMSGGILDFTSCGIYLSASNTLTTSITGGTIRTTYGFTGARTDFNPTGGIIELYGSTDASLSMGAGSNFYDVLVNKSATDKITKESKNEKRMIRNRDGSVVELTRAETVNVASELDINHNLLIDNGIFNLSGYTVNVANGVDVYGTLKMTIAADILNVGDAAYDNLTFKNGSFGNLTAGEVNLASWVSIEAGGLLTATTGNTMNFNAPGLAGIQVIAAGSVFGNINVISSNPFYLSWSSTQQIEVDGNFDLQAGNTIDFQSESMIVHGNFTDDPTSTIYVYDGPVDRGNTEIFSANDNVENHKNYMDSRSRGGSFEIDNDFTLTGLMDVGDGDVLLHGVFELAATGTLTIDGGTFISDASYSRDRSWQNIFGNFNLSSGLFEITNNSLQFVLGTHNITGGTIRVGEIFYATNAGTFQPSNGEVEMSDGYSGGSIVCANGNYFHNLIINDDTNLSTDIIINNNLDINSGTLTVSVNNHDIEIGGNWNNNVGTAGFMEGTQTVTFNGTGDVLLSSVGGENFYNLTIDKPAVGDIVSLQDALDIAGTTTINSGALYSNNNLISTDGNVTINSGGFLYMMSNGVLELANGMSFSVNSGGYFYALGSAGNLSTITHNSTGFYDFNINSGGTIGAQYALFEYMDGSGIYLLPGANVHSTYTFNHCIFRNGHDAPSALLALNDSSVFTSTGASFYNNTSGLTGYNVWKYYDTGNVTFVGATGDFAGPAYEYDSYDRIYWDGFGPDLDITNVVWSDTNPYACDMINVEITIYNNGNVDLPASPGFYVDLYYDLSSPPATFETGDQAEYITSVIPAGDFIVVYFDVVYDVVESWNSYVQVDTDEDITELNEGNNVWGPDAITWNGLPAIDDLTIQYNVGTNEIELNWTYPIPADQYIIYRSADPYDFSGADVFTSSTESYSETATGTKYFYKVTAERTCTPSDNSYKEKTERSRKR